MKKTKTFHYALSFPVGMFIPVIKRYAVMIEKEVLICKNIGRECGTRKSEFTPNNTF